MSGNSFFASKKFKNGMKFVYGWGGAAVIIGAMFKIQHWPGASVVLIGGLTIEAVIFILSAFEPLHEDPDWTLVYPELAMGHSVHDELPEHEGVIEEEISSDISIVEELDNMLAEAKIEPELLESLGKGLRNLSDNANKLGDISQATAASDEFVENIKSASNKVGQLSESYEKASASLMGLTAGTEDGASFGEQLQKVSSNLSALNNVYEMQLKGASDHLQATEQMYSGINELMTNLHDSLDDTKKYKETMSELSQNLSALNKVYGNMLNAMNISRD